MKGLALAALVALAGCSGATQVPDGIPVDRSGDALPTVHGIVVDEAIRPLAGVEVRFLGTDIRTVTDEDGQYRIFTPIEAAQQTLVTAFKLGYWPRTQQVQVSGHLSARLDFGLEPNPYLVPHTAAAEHRGHIRCDARVAAAGQSRGVECTSDERSDRGDVADWMWEINPTPGLAGAVLQVHWQAAWPDTEQLHAWLVAPMAGGQGGQTLANVTGPSPIRLEVTEDVARAMPEWTTIRLHMDLPDSGGQGSAGGVMFGRDQLYEAVATLFYVDPAPPGYVLT